MKKTTPVKKTVYFCNRMPAVILLALSMTLLLTGCRPRAFTEEQRKQVTQAHKQEAYDWFAAHLPDVRVKDDGQAYTDGRNLLRIIEGTYQEQKETYHYLYDYEHDVMYLEKDYEAFLELLTKTLAEELSIDPARLQITFSDARIETTVENDKEDMGITDTTPPVKYLPADRTLSDLCEEVLHAESVFSFYATIYEEQIPAYDIFLFDRLPNATAFLYDVPMQWDQTGISQAAFRKEGITLTLISTAKVEENLYGGYYEKREIGLKEDGQPETKISDIAPEPVSIMQKSQDGFTMQIPTDAWPLVFSDGGTEKLSYAETDKSPGVLYKRYKSDMDVYSFGAYERFYWMSLPKSDMDVYEASSISRENDGIYQIFMKEQEEKKE